MASKVENVIGPLGEPERIEKTKVEYSVNYIYPKIGLRMNFHDGILNTISTLPNFDGKTSRGISLKSSLEEIETTYGAPVVAPGRTKENAKTWA